MKFTRRSTLKTLGGAALAMPFVRPSYAQAGTVNVYMWSDYIGETTVADFEAETGIGVVMDYYASAEESEAKMLIGSTGYDVVDVAGSAMPRFLQAGVLMPLDRTKLTGWSNLDPEILKVGEGFDPGNLYGMPYMWGSVGFTYNVDMVNERLPNADLANMATIFDPANAAKLADCGLSLLDSPQDIGYMVMSWLGIDPSTAGPAEYARMVEAFKPIRQYIATFDNANYLSSLPNGEICVANNWSGDYIVAKSRADEAGIAINLAYFVPRTGAPAWLDLMCVPKDAPHTENAHRFIDFLLRPEVIAGCTNYVGYANANKAATAFVLPELASDPAIYPDAQTLARMYTPKPMTPEQQTMLNRAWTEIKTGN